MLVVIQAVMLFGSAGSLRWLAGWWYISLYILMLMGASFVIIPNRKEGIEERRKGAKGGKSWDYWLTQLMIIPTLGLLVLTGLDERWYWTPPMHLYLRILGGLGFIVGYIVLWAMYTNKYFSQIVRIQTERGHVAITDDPYRYIRHPRDTLECVPPCLERSSFSIPSGGWFVSPPICLCLSPAPRLKTEPFA